MKLRRIETGLYKSVDGRVTIARQVSRQTNRSDQICWEVTLDGKSLPMCWDSKKEAVEQAEKALAKT